MNPYWNDKRAEISNINIPTYVVASYSSLVHTMGPICGWLDVQTKDKWLGDGTKGTVVKLEIGL